MRTSNGRFKPGHSGNAGGRPRGQSITSKLRKLLDDPNATEPSKTNRDKLAEVVLRMALEGDLGFTKMVWERIEGKVPEPIPETDESDGRPPMSARKAAKILAIICEDDEKEPPVDPERN